MRIIRISADKSGRGESPSYTLVPWSQPAPGSDTMPGASSCRAPETLTPSTQPGIRHCISGIYVVRLRTLVLGLGDGAREYAARRPGLWQIAYRRGRFWRDEVGTQTAGAGRGTNHSLMHETESCRLDSSRARGVRGKEASGRIPRIPHAGERTADITRASCNARGHAGGLSVWHRV
jgi:hypothetical protein